MFIGHFAVGFAAGRLVPRVPLPWLLAAPLFLDILWPVLVLAGIERARVAPGHTAMSPFALDDYPWSHSLLMAAMWGLLFAAVALWRGRGRREGFVLWALTVSHWILDWLSHSPDMPLWPGGPEYGLGLWDHVSLTMSIEIAMFAGGAALYLKATAAKHRTGNIALWAMLALLLVLYVVSTFAPPPDMTPVVITGFALTVVFLTWAAWIARHRQVRA